MSFAYSSKYSIAAHREARPRLVWTPMKILCWAGKGILKTTGLAWINHCCRYSSLLTEAQYHPESLRLQQMHAGNLLVIFAGVCQYDPYTPFRPLGPIQSHCGTCRDLMRHLKYRLESGSKAFTPPPPPLLRTSITGCWSAASAWWGLWGSRATRCWTPSTWHSAVTGTSFKGPSHAPSIRWKIKILWQTIMGNSSLVW